MINKIFSNTNRRENISNKGKYMRQHAQSTGCIRITVKLVEIFDVQKKTREGMKESRLVKRHTEEDLEYHRQNSMSNEAATESLYAI